MKNIKIKNIDIPVGKMSLITVSKNGGKNHLYLNSDLMGTVKSYKKTIEWIKNTYVTRNITIGEGKTSSCWTNGDKVFANVLVFHRCLRSDEVKNLYKELQQS